MNYDLKTIEELYFALDKSVPYDLKCGTIINISPILVKDYPLYSLCKNILTIPKNELGISEYVTMSYLEFLINLFNNNEDYSKKLANLLRLSLSEDIFVFKIIDKVPQIKVLNEDGNVKFIITKKEFDSIVKIILHQNDINYDDTFMSTDVKKELEKYYALKYKNIKQPSFEKQRAYVISKTGISIQDINNMTYRCFSSIYHASVDSEIYLGEKMIQASQKYDVKEDVVHPLYRMDKNKLEGAFVSKESLENKIK